MVEKYVVFTERKAEIFIDYQVVNIDYLTKYIADLKNEPYRRADAVRRSQRRRNENMVQAPNSEEGDEYY